MKATIAAAAAASLTFLSANAPAGGAADALTTSPPSGWEIPGEYVVDFNDDVEESAIEGLFKSLGVNFRETDLEDETRIEIASIPTGSAILEKLRSDPRIANVEPHAKVRALGFVPDDPMFEQQWHMKRIGAPDAWGYSSGRGVTVAVIDTGIACEAFEGFHKATDLADTGCVTGYNLVADNEHAYDDHGHGTHVAGTIAQSTNNGLGGAGLAFRARLMPVKVLSGDGWGTTSDVADGIRWAAENGAHVINLSLGGPFNSKILQDAVDFARSRNVVVVAAAGNSGGRVGYPGGSAGVIGVSATDSNDALAWFSARGSEIDIAAPGVNVLQQTVCNGGKDGCEVFPEYSGTSMASPHVAAAAALLMGQGVTRADKVEQALLANASKVGDGNQAHYGAGLLDVGGATRSIFIEQLFVRFAFLLIMSALAIRWARRKSKNPFRVSSGRYWLAGLATGVGLCFFLPFFASRQHLAIDMLARPAAEWDLLVGASIHKFLPLAHLGIPLLLTAMLMRLRGMTPMLAGVAVGMSAYLASVALLGQVATPFGGPLTMLWCALNALACLYLGVLLMRRHADA